MGGNKISIKGYTCGIVFSAIYSVRFAFIFLFKGLSNIISAFSMTSAYKYWWLYLINGIIMLLISFLFFFTPFTAAYSIVFLCSFVFVYWGVALIIFSYDVKPDKTIEQPK